MKKLPPKPDEVHEAQVVSKDARMRLRPVTVRSDEEDPRPYRDFIVIDDGVRIPLIVDDRFPPGTFVIGVDFGVDFGIANAMRRRK